MKGVLSIYTETVPLEMFTLIARDISRVTLALGHMVLLHVTGNYILLATERLK